MSDEPRALTAEEREVLGLNDEAGEEIRLHPILTNAEVLEAQASARRKVLAEQRKNAMRQVEEAEIARLRREEGLTGAAGVQNDMVSITLDLPSWVPYISINMTEGVPYYHGFTYTVPRHVAATLMDIQHRQWVLDDEVEGRSLKQHYGINRGVKLSDVSGESVNPRVVFDA